jgi:hypothetical protein
MPRASCTLDELRRRRWTREDLEADESVLEAMVQAVKDGTPVTEFDVPERTRDYLRDHVRDRGRVDEDRRALQLEGWRQAVDHKRAAERRGCAARRATPEDVVGWRIVAAVASASYGRRVAEAALSTIAQEGRRARTSIQRRSTARPRPRRRAGMRRCRHTRAGPDDGDGSSDGEADHSARFSQRPPSRQYCRTGSVGEHRRKRTRPSSHGSDCPSIDRRGQA